MQNAENLVAYRSARELAVAVYRLTAEFPDSERFGLTTQMRRAAVSIGSNIAEGCGRQASRALVPFLHYAIGSGKELEFQLQLAALLDYADGAELDAIRDRAAHTVRVLIRLSAAVRKRTIQLRVSSRPTAHGPRPTGQPR
jgi:four helix bundle protein